MKSAPLMTALRILLVLPWSRKRRARATRSGVFSQPFARRILAELAARCPRTCSANESLFMRDILSRSTSAAQQWDRSARSAAAALDGFDLLVLAVVVAGGHRHEHGFHAAFRLAAEDAAGARRTP